MNVWWMDALLHLVAGFPIYQILGTIRHELSHAIAYKIAGYGVKELRLLPHWHDDGTFHWGCVMPESRPGATHTIHMHLAPYYTDILLIAAWSVLAVFLLKAPGVLKMINRMEYNGLLFVTLSLLVSPIVDILYNIWKCIKMGRGDFDRAWEYYKTH